MAVFPVRREAAVAGAILICARFEDFFIFARRKLIEGYSDLYALAYTDQDFHSQLIHDPRFFAF